MAEFKINIPDDQVQRVLDAVAMCHGYQATIPDDNIPMDEWDEDTNYIPNPESKAQFANRIVREFLKKMVIACESKAAANTARAAAKATAEAEIDITDPN
jgi:hypothetical protein